MAHMLRSDSLKIVGGKTFSNFNALTFTIITYSSLKEKMFSFVCSAIKAKLSLCLTNLALCYRDIE
jgi:hypothetical protein